MSATVTIYFGTPITGGTFAGTNFTGSPASITVSATASFTSLSVAAGWSGTVYWDTTVAMTDPYTLATFNNGKLTELFANSLTYTGNDRSVYLSSEGGTEKVTLTLNANGSVFSDTRSSIRSITDQYVGGTFDFTDSSKLLASRDGYELLGWSTSSSATTAAYGPYETILVTGKETYYAVWGKIAIGKFWWDGAEGNEDASIIYQGGPIKNLTAGRWNTLQAKIAQLARANGLSYTYTKVASGDAITAAGFNAARNAIDLQPGHGVLPAVVLAGGRVKAAAYNGVGSLKNALNTAINYYNNK